MGEKKLTGEVEQEQIDSWKKKYGKVQGIVVDGHICYIRKIDRNTMSYALSQLSFKMSRSGDLQDGEIEMNMGRLYKTGEAILTNCWIGGSEEIKQDNDLWANACMAAGELVQLKETSLKNF